MNGEESHTRFRRHVSGKLLALALFAAIALVATSCATTYPYGNTAPRPVRVAKIIEWSQDGVAANVIIARMRRSETVYRLSASQIAELSKEGVSDQVLDYMQNTYLQAVRQDQRLQDTTYWMADGPYYYGGPFYWPWPYFAFGADFGYAHGGGGWGGGSHGGGGHEGGGHGGGDHEGGGHGRR